MTRYLPLVFWAAVIFTFVMATLPHPPDLPGNPNDKIQHILAFVTLSVLASAAYPQLNLLRIAVPLSLFGALIELVQSIPALHRDADIVDWCADTLAVAVVVAIVWLWRRRAVSPAENAR
ncbi:MAG: hypothetical protein ABIT16_10875 [Croceibacterium sp.]